MSRCCSKAVKRLEFQNKLKNENFSHYKLSKVIQSYINLFNWPSSYTIASYYPLKWEMDLRSLHQKHPYIAYPALEGKKELKFVLAQSSTRFIDNSLFYEPEKGAEECPLSEIDVFFIPGLGFDRRGVRLGRGGGFYDRLLARSPNSFKVGAAWSVQISAENLPQESQDAVMHALMTEKFLLFTKEARQ